MKNALQHAKNTEDIIIIIIIVIIRKIEWTLIVKANRHTIRYAVSYSGAWGYSAESARVWLYFYILYSIFLIFLYLFIFYISFTTKTTLT